jgi:rhamnulose-1-phosphate aldolase
MSQPSLPKALDALGAAGARLDAIHACEAGAGNISVCFAGPMDLGERFPQQETCELPIAVPGLAGRTLLVTGSGCRLREIGADPAATVAAIVVHEGGVTATLHASPRRAWQRPTSEFNSHLAVHEDQVTRRGVEFQALVHAQPPYLVALSHIAEINETVALSRRVLRWEPETVIHLPDGVGVLPFLVPGSPELMAKNVHLLRDHQLVLWSKHGVMVRSDTSPLAAVDKIEYAETGAMYEHLNTVAGRPSEGLTNAEIKAVADAFGVATTLY